MNVGGGVHRGTSNRNARGGAADRRCRKAWLIETTGTDGITTCWLCAVPLGMDEITVDRHPIPGCKGGTYARDNIRPACGPCNSSTGAVLRA